MSDFKTRSVGDVPAPTQYRHHSHNESLTAQQATSAERAAVVKEIDASISRYRDSRFDCSGEIDALQALRSTIEKGEHL